MGGLPTNRTVNGFTADSTNQKIMYVAMRDGLFKSIDAGVTWNLLGKGLKDVAAVVVNPKKPNEIHAVTVQGVMFRSTDNGKRWQRQK